MEADRVAVTFNHCAFKIVVQQYPRDAVPSGEGTNMTTQEVFHPGVQEEAQINRPRIAQHHDKGQQWPARAADHQRTEHGPVNLSLFSAQGAQTQICLCLRARPASCN